MSRRLNSALLALLAAFPLALGGVGGAWSGDARAATAAAGGTCTWYVSPRGSVRSGGRSEPRPTTLRYASENAAPGDVVCVSRGIYRLRRLLQITRGGTPGSWIVYRSYNGRAQIMAAGPLGTALIQVVAPAAYLQFSRLSFDGGGTNAHEAFLLKQRVHHVRFLNNDVSNMGASGIVSVGADYVTCVGNRIYRFGDGVGWGTGISFNSGPGAFWYDTAGGFHNVIVDNVITGGVDNSSHHSDGNGISVDLGNKVSPTLIANNVVYMNGGRGIVTVWVSGSVYVVNNTLYKNGLDLRMRGIGEAVSQGSSNQVWANNIVYAWERRYTYQFLDSSTAITHSHDAHFGGNGLQSIPSTIANDPTKIMLANPLFADAPVVDATADGQWRNPPAPWTLGKRLSTHRGSPLVDTAVDPRTLPGLDAALLAGITRWVMTAIDGKPRPAGAGFDYGAYER